MTPGILATARACRERSSLSMTRHAEIRAYDHRMVPQAVVEALLDFGVSQPTGGGCEKIHFTRRSWRKLQRYFGPALKAIERYRNCYLVLASDGAIVTVGWLQ